MKYLVHFLLHTDEYLVSTLSIEGMSKTLALYKGETWFVKSIGETYFYCDGYKHVNMVGFYSICKV